MESRDDLAEQFVSYVACKGEDDAASAEMNEERSNASKVEAHITIDQLARRTGARPRTKLGIKKDEMQELELGIKNLRTGEAQDNNYKTSGFRNR